jgi:hypothetical protein
MSKRPYNITVICKECISEWTCSHLHYLKLSTKLSTKVSTSIKRQRVESEDELKQIEHFENGHKQCLLKLASSFATFVEYRRRRSWQKWWKRVFIDVMKRPRIEDVFIDVTKRPRVEDV